MSRIFAEREAAAEGLFARAGEEAFIRKVMRDRRLGLWAASLRSLDASRAEAYARQIVALAVSNADEDELIRTLANDLALDGIVVAPEEIRRMVRWMEVAVADAHAVDQGPGAGAKGRLT